MTRVGRYAAATGTFHVWIAGEYRPMPALQGAEQDRWLRRYAKAATTFRLALTEPRPVADTFSLMTEYGDELVDLLILYDRTRALGTREWLGENATDEQVYYALRLIDAVHSAGEATG